MSYKREYIEIKREIEWGEYDAYKMITVNAEFQWWVDVGETARDEYWVLTNIEFKDSDGKDVYDMLTEAQRKWLENQCWDKLKGY